MVSDSKKVLNVMQFLGRKYLIGTVRGQFYLQSAVYVGKNNCKLALVCTRVHLQSADETGSLWGLASEMMIISEHMFLIRSVLMALTNARTVGTHLRVSSAPGEYNQQRTENSVKD